MIEKIVIKIDDKKTIELNLEQAKKLKNELNELFSEPVRYYTYPDWWVYPPYPTITCGTTCGNDIEETTTNGTAYITLTN